MIRATSEQTLVARCKAGDQAAFTELIQRNSAMALRAIRAITSVHADVEDLMQDSIIRAYKGLLTFDERCKFSTWFTRIAINTSLMHLRRWKNRVEVGLDPEADESDGRAIQIADARLDPERTLIRDQSIENVREAIRGLPANLRVYVDQRYLQERSHREAASSLGISLAAGKSRALRAKNLLEASLRDMFSHPIRAQVRGSGSLGAR